MAIQVTLERELQIVHAEGTLWAQRDWYPGISARTFRWRSAKFDFGEAGTGLRPIEVEVKSFRYVI